VRRRIAYAVIVLAVIATGAFLWTYREPRPLPSLPPYNSREAEERIRQEWERLGPDGFRAKLEADAARQLRLEEAAERQRKQEQLRRQETYFVAFLSLAVIVAALRLYLRRVRTYRVVSDERSPSD
jgi:hypothetical protein